MHSAEYSNTPPPKHLEQCHQCDLRPLFNQYDCLSFCASSVFVLRGSEGVSGYLGMGMSPGRGPEVVMWKST